MAAGKRTGTIAELIKKHPAPTMEEWAQLRHEEERALNLIQTRQFFKRILDLLLEDLQNVLVEEHCLERLGRQHRRTLEQLLTQHGPRSAEEPEPWLTPEGIPQRQLPEAASEQRCDANVPPKRADAPRHMQHPAPNLEQLTRCLQPSACLQKEDAAADGVYDFIGKPMVSAQDALVKPTAACAQRGDERPFPKGYLTLTVRNIPARYSKEMLFQEWVPDGSYNFLYLPYSFKQRRTAGYAFVNFTSDEAALDFYNRWHGNCLSIHGNSKPLNIGLAEVQGLEQNLLHIKMCKILRVKNEKFQPSIFVGTEEVDFREVMRQLNAPGDALPEKMMTPMKETSGVSIPMKLEHLRDNERHFHHGQQLVGANFILSRS